MYDLLKSPRLVDIFFDVESHNPGNRNTNLTKETVKRRVDALECARMVADSLIEREGHDYIKHGAQIADYVFSIGKMYEKPIEKIMIWAVAAELHDIGKIYIRPEILNKPGPLNEDERKVMRTHPILSQMIISDDLSYLGKVVSHHHENFDGTGYCEGAKGDNICFGSRIILVLDSFNAMTHMRPYNKNRIKTRDQAIEELISCSGTQFDSDIVKCFIRIVRNPKNFVRWPDEFRR